MNKIEVFAPNVRHGGGKVLLIQLLEALIHLDLLEKAYVSNALYDDFQNNDKIYFRFYKRTLGSNLLSYYHLHFNNNLDRRIIFFGNWPPLLKINGKAVLYIHNKLLLIEKLDFGLALATKIRLIIVRNIINLFKNNVDTIFVQTKEMQYLASRMLKPTKVELKPFISPKHINLNTTKKYDFIYSSYGYPYKNHDLLIESWCLLAKENIFPSLYLTLDSKMDVDIISKIKNAKSEYNIKIHIGTDLSNHDIYELYSKSRSLIWPSLLESFGLPLIEAVVNNLDIIAADLPYIYDILDPSLSFDPYDKTDIAEKVKRYVNHSNKDLKKPKLNVSVESAEQFIKNLKWD